MKQETKEKIVAVSASVFLFVVVVFVTLGWIEVQHYIRSPTIIINKLTTSRSIDLCCEPRRLG